MLQEGIFTIFNEIDEMKSELNAMLKPNGSQQAPARSCYDLFLCNPSFEAGQWLFVYYRVFEKIFILILFLSVATDNLYQKKLKLNIF